MLHVLALILCNKALFLLVVKNIGFASALLWSGQWFGLFIGCILYFVGAGIIYEAAFRILVRYVPEVIISVAEIRIRKISMRTMAWSFGCIIIRFLDNRPI